MILNARVILSLGSNPELNSAAFENSAWCMMLGLIRKKSRSPNVSVNCWYTTLLHVYEGMPFRSTARPASVRAHRKSSVFCGAPTPYRDSQSPKPTDKAPRIRSEFPVRQEHGYGNSRLLYGRPGGGFREQSSHSPIWSMGLAPSRKKHHSKKY